MTFLSVAIAPLLIFGNAVDGETVEKLSQVENSTCDDGLSSNFSYIDYIVLVWMLLVSCGVGLIFKCLNRNQEKSNSDDFLLGGSNNKTFPVAISLATSFVTAIEILGNPAEMYNYGSQFWMICVSFIIIVPITSQLYLPVFMKHRFTSCFEYLEKRFSKHVRYLASSLYILQMVFYTAVSVYAPALALSKFTGLNTYLSVTLVYLVCIFYSSQGGMKAVIITDLFQATVLITSLLVVLHYGEIMVGGYGVVFSESFKTDRLEIFIMDFSPTIRHSFWSVVVGGSFYWTSMFCGNQASIQKYLSVKEISQVRTALWCSCVFLIVVYSLTFYLGMIMVSYFHTCDPIMNNVISSSDQLLPYFVIKVLGDHMAIPGIFVSGIFAASLGTVAVALTSISAAVFQDFALKFMSVPPTPEKGAMSRLKMFYNSNLPVTYASDIRMVSFASEDDDWLMLLTIDSRKSQNGDKLIENIAKYTSIVAGLVSFTLIFIVEHLGSVLQVALSFNGMVGGVTLGLFTLGMFLPWANHKGALSGALISLALVSWLCFGSQVAISSGNVVEETKFKTISNCTCYNDTMLAVQDDDEIVESVWPIYKISYLWYSGIGCVCTVVLGTIISFLTTPTKFVDVPVDLLSPPLYSFYTYIGKLMQSDILPENINV